MAPVYEYEVKPGQDGFLRVSAYGTKFGIECIENATGRRIPVPITCSPESGLFYALFPKDDVDFELILENNACTNRDFHFDIGIHGKEESFILDRKDDWRLKTVKSFGRKFHFLVQTGRDGQSVVAAAASRHGLSYEDASVMVSRMEFKKLRFGKVDDQPDKEKKKLQIFVKTTRGNTITLNVSSDDTVDYVKQLIENREGIPASDQRLMYSICQLKDDQKLSSYEIPNEATLILYAGKIKGGAITQSPLSCSSSISSTEIIRITEWNEDEDDEDFNFDVPDDIGERGVICFGDKSDQKFRRSKCAHRSSGSVGVKPFTIEMRMASRFSFL